MDSVVPQVAVAWLLPPSSMETVPLTNVVLIFMVNIKFALVYSHICYASVKREKQLITIKSIRYITLIMLCRNILCDIFFSQPIHDSYYFDYNS
jgi:hypothetical protein